MTVVKQKKFINAAENDVNRFLAQIPAENVISTHFSVYGYLEQSDEWTVIFYKEVAV